MGGYWLTKGGKIILMKSLLSALPIFHAAFLLAPRNVMEEISKLLRDFLWQGGKGNEKNTFGELGSGQKIDGRGQAANKRAHSCQFSTGRKYFVEADPQAHTPG